MQRKLSAYGISNFLGMKSDFSGRGVGLPFAYWCGYPTETSSYLSLALPHLVPLLYLFYLIVRQEILKIHWDTLTSEYKFLSTSLQHLPNNHYTLLNEHNTTALDPLNGKVSLLEVSHIPQHLEHSYLEQMRPYVINNFFLSSTFQQILQNKIEETIQPMLPSTTDQLNSSVLHPFSFHT